MTTLTEQEKTVLLAEKVLQRTCIKHFDVILTDDNGHSVQYFMPYQDWNHTHMVLEIVMTDEELFPKWKQLWGAHDSTLEYYMHANREELMDAVLSLITL